MVRGERGGGCKATGHNGYKGRDSYYSAAFYNKFVNAFDYY